MPTKKIEKKIDGDTYMTNTLPAGKGKELFTTLLGLVGSGISQANGADEQAVVGALLAIVGRPEVDAITTELFKGLYCNLKQIDFDEHFSGDYFDRVVPLSAWLLEENFLKAFLGFKRLAEEKLNFPVPVPGTGKEIGAKNSDPSK